MLLNVGALDALVARVPRTVFVTGKGGVGKTSVACALALALADRGQATLLVSTDPASNLDEVLGVRLGRTPTPVPAVPRLSAQNLDPVAAAAAYRERVVGPYRALLPAAAVASVEEQLSGACTVEIAAFDEFARLLADPAVTAGCSHVVFDTAPTGHTLRLLELPAAWTHYLEAGAGSASCLGPLAGLAAQRALYEATRVALSDPAATAIVLVARPDAAALAEAERTRTELAALGVSRLELVVNGVFAADPATRDADPVAVALEDRGARALAAVPSGLAALARTDLPLLARQVVGLDAVRAMAAAPRAASPRPASPRAPLLRAGPSSRGDGPLAPLLDALAAAGHGVVFTMGKGGVGKTAVARAIALGLARRGHRVHATTTDPAGREAEVGDAPPTLRTSRIDPKAEVEAYAREVLAAAAGLDAAGRALLEEDLRSPCTEEIAVFRALARVVADGADGFVVVDTAPTGHTVLLLDAAGAYHREVSRAAADVPEAVRALLPRLRDPAFTRVVVVALPEATPVHEAAALQADLRRAGIDRFAWVVTQALTPLEVRDPVLVARRAAEAAPLAEVAALSPRVFVVPWQPDPPVAAPEGPSPAAAAPRGGVPCPSRPEVPS